LLLFYEEGNRRKHVAPDVFVVFGVPKKRRDNYLLWQEGKGPDVVIEVTSKTTKREDQTKKWTLYQDVLRVPEYFQFDPTEDYLKPPMQGHRLVDGQYVPIEPVDGRLPSVVVALHLERDGSQLRLVDPATGQRLPTYRERVAEAEAHALEAQNQAVEAQNQAVEAQNQAVEAQNRAAQVETENERLRQELEELRRQLGQSGPNGG